MFVISQYFGPSLGKPEYSYIWTYRYTSNTMTPIDFMCWERGGGVFVINLIPPTVGEVH